MEASGAYTTHSDTNELSFEILTTEKMATQIVSGSGSRAVSSTAEGTVTFYNTQTSPQKLITNTRIASPGGLVFRIHSPITIPAAKGGTPGSVSATVYAAAPGSEYNVGPTSFTLPAFKESGSPLFTQITAKSLKPIAGGSSGNEPVVALDVENAARASLMKALEADLLVEIKSQVPKGYILLEGASTVAFQPAPSTPSAESGKVDLKEKGTISALIFKSSELAKTIALRAESNTYQNEPLELDGQQSLSFSTKDFPASKGEVLTFSLTGSASVVWTIDTSHVASSVAGKTRVEAETSLRNYPEIREAKQTVLILRPFWRSTFPEDPGKIKVHVLPPVSSN
jgi:hypothetical protein